MERFWLWPGWIWRLEILPYAKRFRVWARFHDIAYSIKWWTEKDRRRADTMFLRLMIQVCEKPLHYYFAYRYYEAVKKYWMFFFNYTGSKESKPSTQASDDKTKWESI